MSDRIFSMHVTTAKELLRLETKYNPLRQIEIGTQRELSTAYAFADKILADSDYCAEVKEDVKQLLAVSAMHCIYAYYVDPFHQPVFPTVDRIASFLQVQAIKDCGWDETGEEQVYVKRQSFADSLFPLSKFTHIPIDKIVVDMYVPRYAKVKMSNRFGWIDNGFWRYIIRKCDIKALYPYYFDFYSIYDFETDSYAVPHPFIWKTFGSLEERKRSVVNETANYAVCALNEYMYRHSDCTSFALEVRTKGTLIANMHKQQPAEKESYLFGLVTKPKKKKRFGFRLPFFHFKNRDSY